MAGGDAARCAEVAGAGAASAAVHRRAALDTSAYGTLSSALDSALATVLSAKDALYPHGWRLPGPPWCCGACCGDVACFPCYALPYDYVTQRVAFLQAAAAQQLPAVLPPALPLPDPAPLLPQLAQLASGLLSAPPAGWPPAQTTRLASGGGADAVNPFQDFTARGEAPPVSDMSAAAQLLGAG